MSRHLPAASLLGIIVFALSLALPALATDADASSRHRSSSARSSSGVSVSLRLGSGSHRHSLRHRSSSLHRYHSPSLRHHSSLRHRSPSLRHRHSTLHRKPTIHHRYIYPHRSQSFYAPRRRLLDRHYSYFRVFPPSSSITIYRSPSYFSYSQLDPYPRSSITTRREADLERYRRENSDHRQLERYRYNSSRLTTPRREYVYPYLDGSDADTIGGGDSNAAVGQGNGWNLLRTDNAADARNVFGQQVEQEPRSAEAHIGYALAVADGGEYAVAVEAMRNAVLIDPATLSEIPDDHVMERRVRQLIDRMADDQADDVSATDLAFLRSALHTMLGDFQAARQAIDEAVADREPAAFALKGFLDSREE